MTPLSTTLPMASPSSRTEPVNIRSTATTTLWELVSPMDSCRCAMVLESILPPRAITMTARAELEGDNGRPTYI